MTIQDYTRRGINIDTLPLKILMGLDIKTVEEQAQVQKLVDARRKITPVARPVNLKSDITDFRNGEQEKEFQKVIDERVASMRPYKESEMTEENNPEIGVQISDVPGSILEELSAQESTLKEKIKNLKMQAGK